MARDVRAFASRQAAALDSGAAIVGGDVFPPKLGSVTTLLPSAILKRASRRGRGVPSKLLFFAHDLVVCRSARQATLLGGQLQGFLAVEFGLPDQFFDAVRKTLCGICLCTRVRGCLGSNKERDFPAGGALLERTREFGEFAAAELFVHLRHFARHAGAAIAKHFPSVGNALRDPVRRFVEDDGAVLDAQPFEARRRSPLRAGKKPTKRNSSLGRPEAEREASSAEGPGIGTTGMQCRRHSVTRRCPGSETSGIPASLTSAIFAPCSNATTSSGARVNSLCS